MTDTQKRDEFAKSLMRKVASFNFEDVFTENMISSQECSSTFSRASTMREEENTLSIILRELSLK